MQRFLISLVFLFLISPLVAEEEILPEDPFSSSLVNTQTLLPTTVHSISVLSGEWLYSIPDLAIQGPEPLALTRTLSSDGSYSKKLGFQWDFNLPSSLVVEREAHRLRARYRQSCGITTIHEAFHYQKDASSHTLVLNRTKGLTNCLAGEISARTNLHNTVLALEDSDEQCVATNGYGHVTYFKRVHETLPLAKFGKEREEETTYTRYKSDFERKANGNLLFFRKNGLYAFNPTQDVCYGWIKWDPVEEDKLELMLRKSCF